MSEEIKKNAENINDRSEKVVGGARPSASEVTYNIHCSKCHTVLSTCTQSRRAAVHSIDNLFCPQCNSYQTVYAKEAE